ncbi:hypothetical protein R6Z07F_012164 [Ovis aries]
MSRSKGDAGPCLREQQPGPPRGSEQSAAAAPRRVGSRASGVRAGLDQLSAAALRPAAGAPAAGRLPGGESQPGASPRGSGRPPLRDLRGGPARDEERTCGLLTFHWGRYPFKPFQDGEQVEAGLRDAGLKDPSLLEN